MRHGRYIFSFEEADWKIGSCLGGKGFGLAQMMQKEIYSTVFRVRYTQG